MLVLLVVATFFALESFELGVVEALDGHYPAAFEMRTCISRHDERP